MSLFRNELPRVVLAVVLVLVITSYFAEYQPLETLVRGIMDYTVIITAFALPVGAINLIGIHTKNIQEKKEGVWYFSAWLLFCLALMSVTGVVFGTTNYLYEWIYNNVVVAAGSSVYAMTGFFIASAAYRAFKARNLDSFVLLFCGVVIMLRNAPIGEAIFPPILLIGKWLSDFGQTTGWRVIWVGVSIGYIGLAIRYITGKEKGLIGE